jgi:hypothetical protein
MAPPEHGKLSERTLRGAWPGSMGWRPDRQRALSRQGVSSLDQAPRVSISGHPDPVLIDNG